MVYLPWCVLTEARRGEARHRRGVEGVDPRGFYA